jgi:peptide/nickel transport system substrate-binding protein
MNLSRRNIYILLVVAAIIVVVVAVVLASRLIGGGSPRPTSTARPTLSPTATTAPTATALPLPAPVVESKPVIVLSAQAVNTLDPYLMTTMLPEKSIAAHIWDPLVRLNDDLEIEPSLAESWQFVNDFTWELKLRQGVSFHNGEPFSAHAVKFSLERTQTLTGSLVTFAADVGLEQVEILDDHTVRLHIAQPLVNLPHQLASVAMLPPDYYGAGNTSRQPVGSGPYVFQEWSSDGSVTLIANKDYWGGAPTIETLIFEPLMDPEQRLTALRAGQAHIVSDIPPKLFGGADGALSQGVAVESTRRLFVGVRGDEGTPLADARVRQALNYAVDVDSIIQATMADYGQRYGSYVGPPNANPSLVAWSYDPEQARELLAEAGYPAGFSTSMDVPMGRYVNGEVIAQAIAANLAEVNVQVELHYREWPDFVQRLLNLESAPLFLLAINSRGNDLEDAQNLAFLFPFNPTNWYNADFEALLTKASSTYNDENRTSLLWQAQAIVRNEAPWVFLWRLYDFYGVSKDLNWSPRPDGLVYLYRPLVSE